MSDGGWPVRVEDLRGCSFERWLSYAFDRPVPATDKSPSWWHDDGVDDVELLIDARLQLEHAMTLFRNPRVLSARFSAKQIDQGFWFLALGQIHRYGAFFAETLWDPEVDIDLRCRCVAAMFDLYEKLFAPFPTDTAAYMWWDLIASVLEESDVSARPGPPVERLRQEMVSTLTRILSLGARHCQEAALHGLNHIATAAERAPIIEQFLALGQADDKLRAYALACRDGHAP